jgi:hypothetical protein
LCELVLSQTTVSLGQCALASASAANSPAPAGEPDVAFPYETRAFRCIRIA